MRKEYILILYDLGLSLPALSKLYQHSDEHLLISILNGNFLDVHMNYNIFSERDIDLLSQKIKIENSKGNVEKLLERFYNESINYYIYYDEEYPKHLKFIADPPFIIFVKGDIKLANSERIISIVGSRKISMNTELQTKKTVKELVENNFITVSGLAFGTDILVHKETIKQRGKTIAVLPSTIFEVQPKTHKEDAERIIGCGGAIISEYYKDPKLNRFAYIHRNRIISGISPCLLVTECTEKSGTMHTARFAYKQMRKIFCFENDSSGVQKIIDSKSAIFYNGINNLL
ncbi:DNA-processing protein DprA [Listeria monocytogenes]|nr:DNA-processing protein DprA [Listeria monocytogenes]